MLGLERSLSMMALELAVSLIKLWQTGDIEAAAAAWACHSGRHFTVRTVWETSGWRSVS